MVAEQGPPYLWDCGEVDGDRTQTPERFSGGQDPYPPSVYLGAIAPLAVLDFWRVKFPASLGTFGSVISLLWGLDSQLAGLDTSPDIFDLHWWLLQVHSLHWLDLGSKAGQRGDPVYIAASLVFRIRVMAQLSAEARLIRQRVTRATHAGSEAAQALRGANAQQLEKPTGFLEANGTVQCPKKLATWFHQKTRVVGTTTICLQTMVVFC